LEVDSDYSNKELQRYLLDLELREKGASLSELGYSERRQRQLPEIRTTQGTTQRGQSVLTDHQATPAGSIAHLKMEGIMQVQDGISTRGVRSLTSDLQDAYANPNISAVLLEVESGGGEALAGTLVQNAIQERNKPVYVYAHTAASAAYKAVVGADKILASGKESQVGSIGTMTSISKRLVEFYRQNRDEIYAEGSSNKNREFRAYLNGDKGPIIDRLNKVNEFFVQAVKDNRRLTGPEDQIQDTLSGHIFNAVEAEERGLIDGIATQQEAIRQLAAEADRQDHNHFSFHQKEADMSKTKFWQQLIQGINQKLGLSISQDATEEEAANAVEQAPSIEEMRQQITEEIRNELQGEQQTTNTQLEEQLQQLTNRLDEQSTQIEQLLESKQTLEGQLAGFKAKRAAGNKQTNGDPPKPGDYQTVQNYMQSASPEGKSQY